jgi:hypothetical protein
MIYQNTPVASTVDVYCSLLVLIFSLFKPKAPVCTSKMAEDGLKYFLCMVCLGYIINLFPLPFTMSLCLIYWGKWLDLTCRTPGFGSGACNSSFVSLDDVAGT